MSRGTRIALLAAAAVLVAGAGGALAQRDRTAEPQPHRVASSHEPDPQDTAPEALDHAVDRLADHGIEVETAAFEGLAAAYGVGGAVRLAAWSDASGLSVDELRAMRDDGMGWGQIANELDLHPGIGSIMGGGNPPAHARDGGQGGGQGGGPPERTPDD